MLCRCSPQALGSYGGSRVGIDGMRERVRQFRGNMKIASNSAGTTILVNIAV
jgi:signal transduction histidine kinase